jgi:hypothetical protein
MKKLMEDWAKKADEIPMPFGGKILLALYWYGWKIFGPGQDWSTYKGTVRALNTPLKVQAWLWANVKYTKDTKEKDGDEWQPSKVTFKRKKGDCEDWAIFGCDCLKKHYDCLYLCMYYKKSGHATLLIEDGKKGKLQKWKSIGTYGYKKHKGKDYGDIIPDWWPEYRKWDKYRVKDEGMKTIIKKEK